MKHRIRLAGFLGVAALLIAAGGYALLAKRKIAEPAPAVTDYVAEGDKSAKAGQITEAVIAYNRAMAIAPQDERSYIGLAIVYELVNRPDLAIEAMEQLQATNPNAPQLYSRLAEANLGAEDLKAARDLGAEDLKAARDLGEEAVKREPDSARAYSVYGIALTRFRYWDSAEKTLLRARQLAPEDTDIGQVLTDVYLQQGAFEKATRLAEELVKQSPDSARLYYKLGWGYGRQTQQGDSLDRAVTHLKRATELAPKWFEPYAELGRVYQTQGKTKEAIAAFEQAWNLNPNVPGVAFNLTALYRKQGDPRAVEMDRAFKQQMKDKEKFTALRRDYNAEETDTKKALALAEVEGRSRLYGVALHRIRKLLTADPVNLPALRLYQRLDQESRVQYANYLRPGPGISTPGL